MPVLHRTLTAVTFQLMDLKPSAETVLSLLVLSFRKANFTPQGHVPLSSQKNIFVYFPLVDAC